jgi:hypothetical protein
MQTISRLAKLRYLPSGASDSVWRSDHELALLKHIIDDADEDAFNRCPGLYVRGIIGSDPIDLEALLEASTITTELLHLYAVHGIEAMERYYNRIVRKTESVYRLLLERFVSLYDGDLVGGIDALYCALGVSLYSSDNPVNRLISLYDDLRKDLTVVRRETAAWLSNPFPDEDDFASRVYREWLVDSSSNEPLEPARLEGHEFPLDELAYVHAIVTSLRDGSSSMLEWSTTCISKF